MRTKNFLSSLVVFALLGSVSAVAQDKNPFVGVWERTSLKNDQGEVRQPPLPPQTVIFSANGYFSQVGTPAGRKKVDKPVKDLSREELLDRFTSVAARHGTYKVSGNKLIRKDLIQANPNQEGRETVQEFKLEKDGFVLTYPGKKFEARFRRVK